MFRSANEEDQEQVLTLLNNVFNEQARTATKRDHRYWDWKFRENPFGPSILTVGDSGGKIVGVDNLWPWEFCYKGRVIKAIQPCDTVVHANYRGNGLFKKMRKYGLTEAENRGYSLAFNFPNENSLPGNRSIGANYLGQIPWCVKILKPFNLVKSKVFECSKKDFNLHDKYEIDTNTIDEIASNYEKDDESITIHRVQGFHQWRYASHPSRTYGMINISEGSKQSVVIFTVITKGSSREMVVVDMIGDTGQKSRMINSIIKAGREINADFIAIMSNHQFKFKQLWLYGFFTKRLKNMVVTPINLTLSVEINSFENWSMVAGMHDSI